MILTYEGFLRESNNQGLDDKINEFGELANQIDMLQHQLKQLKSQYKSIEGEIRPVLEGLDDLEQKSLLTDKYLVTIKRKGYEKTNPKYKKAFEEALTKVNAQTRRVLEETLEATKETTRVASSIGVQSLNENFVKRLLSKIGRLFKKLAPKFKKTSKEYDNLNSILKKM